MDVTRIGNSKYSASSISMLGQVQLFERARLETIEFAPRQSDAFIKGKETVCVSIERGRPINTVAHLSVRPGKSGARAINTSISVTGIRTSGHPLCAPPRQKPRAQ